MVRSVWLAGMIACLGACSQAPNKAESPGTPAAAAEPSGPDVIIPFAEVAFADEAPGQPQRLGKLWGERANGPAGTYLRTPGGFEAPLHSHTADYRAVVIQGAWSHWIPEQGQASGEPLPVGSYWTQRADQPHKDACLSDEPCVILLINRDPYVTNLEGPASRL
jgi:hypothetical protein